jgi:hypothetical protein
MSKKREATQKSHPEKVKQGENTKIIVSIEFKARQIGKIIALDWLPDDVQKLIICKIAAFELQIESMVNQSKVGGGNE